MQKWIKYNLEYKNFKNYTSNFYGTISDRCRLFFAFNDDQFKEGLEKHSLKIQDVISIGYNGFIPKNYKTMYKNLWDKYDTLYDSYFKVLHNNKNCKKYLKQAIKYELANYEYGYTRYTETLKDVYNMLGFNQNKHNNKLFWQSVNEYLDAYDKLN